MTESDRHDRTGSAQVLNQFHLCALLCLFLPQLRSEWVGNTQACETSNTASNTLTVISIVITDIALLLIMLLGLLRLRRYGGGFGLTNILWKQVWAVLTTCGCFG